MSGRGEWLPWRRDWSKTPNAWKAHVAFTVLWVVLGAFYLATGNLVGIGYLVLAAVSGFFARYTFRRSRLPTQLGQDGSQPH